MGQRTRILAQILGYYGWAVEGLYFEGTRGQRVQPVHGFELAPEVRVILHLRRRWAPRCADCGAICRKLKQVTGRMRRWEDLSWAGRPVALEYAPQRVRCEHCGSSGVEMVAWADPGQRQTKRFQQRMALECASMPTNHVAALHGVDWKTVRRAEVCALVRWDVKRTPAPLRDVGVDEKYLGRRGEREDDYVTIVSNNETGEPLWIGYGRSEQTLAAWLATLSVQQKAGIRLFVMDMHRPFLNAVRNDPVLKSVPIVHDPFHVMKRALDAVDETRRAAFFRAGPEMRAIGRGKRWLVLRAWERCGVEQQAQLKELFRLNRQLARTYQIVEELRAALDAPDRKSIQLALTRIALRTQRRDNVPLRQLHESLLKHRPELVALAEHRPATGRIEALNNNWETLVRRARGYRDLDYLLLKLRFMVANPVRTEHGILRFLALGLPPPPRHYRTKSAA